MIKALKSKKQDYFMATFVGIGAATLSLIIINNLGIKINTYIPFLILTPLSIVGIRIAHFLKTKNITLYQFIKFLESGGFNWVLDLSILNLLIMTTGKSTGLWFSLYKAISFTFSVTSSYIFNRLWVFAAKKNRKREEFVKFTMVSSVGLTINVLSASIALFILIQMSPLEDKILANIAAVFGSILALTWNFYGYKKLVFRAKKIL